MPVPQMQDAYNQREERMLDFRREGRTYKFIAEYFGVSKQRVHQICIKHHTPIGRQHNHNNPNHNASPTHRPTSSPGLAYLPHDEAIALLQELFTL